MEPRTYETAVSRREVLCAGGTAAFSALVAGLLGTAKPAYAQPLAGSVPEVDRLAVRVVTDSYHLALAPSTKVNGVEVQRYGFPVSAQPPRKALVSEFGLSLHLESQRGHEVRHILLDFGYTPETLTNNLDVFGVSADTLDALVLSHGHFDHFGGLVGFLRANTGKLKAHIPLYLGGEECFCTRELTIGGQVNNFGALDRKALAEANVKVTIAEGPALVADHAFTTGQIARTTFERVLSPTRMTIGLADGLGCFPDQFPEEKRTAKVIPDEFDHEHATCYHVKGRGLVVLTSCGHRGVVNSVRRAMAVSGVNKVHAVLGGFHLAPHQEEYVRNTVLALKDINPDVVMPMHCTGEVFIDIMAKEMPGKLVRSYTGSRYIFSA
jgi:7,8-dihydropterin-6-yl-methyl-4-(beta-D-ribofuranosyl)aminobenzene 5'-phosphate synthase